MRETLKKRHGEKAAKGEFPVILGALELDRRLVADLEFAWSRRGGVTHEGKELEKHEASRVLDVVSDFIEKNA